MPLIQLRSFTNLPPPLISHNKNNGSEAPLFCCDSFPPGEAKNSEDFGVHHSTGRSTLRRRASECDLLLYSLFYKQRRRMYFD